MGNWKYNASVSDMIQTLNLQSLAARREIARLKMLHGLYHKLKFAPDNIMPKRARSPNLRFTPIVGRVEVFNNSFFPVTIDQWNLLPASVVNIECPEKFASSLYGLK